MISNWPLLSIIIFLPLTGAVFLLCMSNSNKDLDVNIFHRNIKFVTLWTSLITLLGSIIILLNFDSSFSGYQFIEEFKWVKQLNIYYSVGVDGLSLPLILLTTFLFPICILFSWKSIKNKIREYMILFLILETLIIGIFSSLDLILFYIFVESIFIPIFLIVGIWGGNKSLKALYKMIIFSLLTSFIFLFAIIYIYINFGTTNLSFLLNIDIIPEIQIWLFLAFMASFAIKTSLWPFHLWVSEINSECPTAFSIILICIILKISCYGLLRFSLPLFPVASYFFTPLVYTLSIIGIIYTSLTAIRQTDLKRIIAYTSVAHMNLVVMGLFSFNTVGLEGAIIQSISHGFVSSALFLIIGVVYDRHHTRMVKYYSGLVHTMPLFITIFLLFTMANIALPGTSSFVGEFLILVGAFQANTMVTMLAATGMVLGGAYSLWLYNRVAFGNLKVQSIHEFSDINRREFFVQLPLILGTLLMGIYPEIFLDPMHVSIANLVEQINLGISK